MNCITIVIPTLGDLNAAQWVKLQILADLPSVCKDRYENVFFVAQYEMGGNLNFIIATDYLVSTVKLFLSIYYPFSSCHYTKKGELK